MLRVQWSTAAAALLLAAASLADAKFYSDCGSQASVGEVAVSGCAQDASECVLKRGTNVTFDIAFTPKSKVSKVKAVVHGIIMDLPVPFPLPNPDGCAHSGLACPIQGGQEARYRASLPVLKSYPRVSVHVKWQLQGDHDEDLVCLMVPARLH